MPSKKRKPLPDKLIKRIEIPPDEMILRFDETVSRPDYLPDMIDPRLFIINEDAAIEMRKIADELEWAPDGKWVKPSACTTKVMLENYSNVLTKIINKHKLRKIIEHAILSTIPRDNQSFHRRDIDMVFWEFLSSTEAAVHVLYAIGLSPHVVTAVYCLMQHMERETGHTHGYYAAQRRKFKEDLDDCSYC